jgi:hypothetical protein
MLSFEDSMLLNLVSIKLKLSNNKELSEKFEELVARLNTNFDIENYISNLQSEQEIIEIQGACLRWYHQGTPSTRWHAQQ